MFPLRLMMLLHRLLHPNAPLASTNANDSLALLANIVSMEVINEATLADDGRDPIKEASVDVAETSTM